MLDKTPHKFRPGDTVRDRELGTEYVIVRNDYHQMNGIPWYRARRIDNDKHECTSEIWLILVKKGGIWS